MPPPPPFYFYFLYWRPVLRLRLCALYARGLLSRGIYYSVTFDGGDVLSTVFGCREGRPYACAINSWTSFHETPVSRIP